jgi:KUP system potassium uptake protein
MSESVLPMSPADQQPSPRPEHLPCHVPRHGLAVLTLGALGVVYGDIGTSPLYTIKEIFSPAGGVPLTPDELIGAISTLFWALMFVVTLKYVVLILRADNRGEGGILALTALATQSVGRRRAFMRTSLLLLGVFGATLFYGDSIITPAVSVLGAMEGMTVITPGLAHWVVPFSLVILVGLFAMQRKGTGTVGKLFGPIILVWFATLAISGLWHIIEAPRILIALNPWRAAVFLYERGWQMFAAVGAIVLALTGAEALYADMGHFGRKPIQLAWTGMVLPSLALNYLGQGALLLNHPEALENPFFHMFPKSWMAPAVVLATLAAIIASQAVISGAYSMTQQSMQLGFLPRMDVRHTSARERGQIYMPVVNWTLLLGVLAAVLAFRSSAALAGAYGIAVTLTMMITTLLMWFVMRDGWNKPFWMTLPPTLVFLAVDIVLVAGCAVKFFDGGWFPLAMGGILFAIMTTWRRGRAIILDAVHRDGLALKPFVETLAETPINRAARVAVYPVADPTTVPSALLHNLKHNQVLHECNVILHVRFTDQPWVDESQRAEVEALAPGFWRVVLTFGFMESPDVPRALMRCGKHGLEIPLFETTYFLSRQTVVPTRGSGMRAWREALFAALSRNASNVANFFHLPDNAVVELGTRVQI